VATFCFAAVALPVFFGGVAAAEPEDYPSLVAELVATAGSVNVANRITYLDRDNPLPVAPLLPLLQHESPRVREGAAYALRLMQNRKQCAVALLAAAQQETDVATLRQLVQGLGAIRDAAATPLLSDLMVEHSSPHVRYAAVEAEYWIRDTNAVPALVKATRDTAEKVAVRALYVLGRIGNGQAVPRLLQVAKGDDQVARLSALQALGMVGAAEAAPLLRSFLNTQDVALLKQVVWALGRAHDGPTVASLLPLLEHDDKAIAEETRLSLIEIGSDEVLAHFIGQYKREPDDALALGIIRSLYGKRDQVVGEPVKDLTLVQTAALARHLSAVLEKEIKHGHIKSVRRACGALFVQVVFDHAGSDFVVIQTKNGAFRAGKVIASWIA